MYLEQLGSKIDFYGVEPEHTYNMDETSFMVGVVGRQKRIFSKRLFKKKQFKRMLQDGNHEWISLLAGVCADGTVFQRFTAPKARRKYRLLLVDGHSSHLTEEFLEYCYRHKILLAAYSPHSTYTLQPLNVMILKPLNTAYSKKLATHLYRH
jgi:hypothetical protein